MCRLPRHRHRRPRLRRPGRLPGPGGVEAHGEGAVREENEEVVEGVMRGHSGPSYTIRVRLNRW